MKAKDNPLYLTWAAMLRRCKVNKNYQHLEPKVLEEWTVRGKNTWAYPPGLTAFSAWVEENLGPKPDKWSLDRIDNNIGYLPGNLRWATRSTQASNRRPYKCPNANQPPHTEETKQRISATMKRVRNN